MMRGRNLATGFVWHERYMWHDPGNFAGPLRPGPFIQPGEHVEHPETKRRIKNLLDATGLTEKLAAIAPRPATREQLLRFHTATYVDRIAALSREMGGEAGQNAWFASGGYDIAALSAGGVIAAVEAVVAGEVANAYALVRPPGHHAEPERGMGFCLFANAGVAGLHAIEALGLARIAFVDWDVHHGNGTQAGFWRDPRALVISIHQDGVFPLHSGKATEIGDGSGTGYTINIPLPPGCGAGAYLHAMDTVVLPALNDFGPDLIIVPCGFDAGNQDPLGRMMLGPNGFRALAARISEAARALCGGRLVLCHEGGYSAATVPFHALAVIEEISGLQAGYADPISERLDQTPGQDLLPHQAEAIAAARQIAESHGWRGSKRRSGIR
jgi:acetoin utilization deacetylase AcuC-like enzyme